MKTKQSTILLAAAAVTVLNFNSCKKYDDGPAFSLKSKNSRLSGTWELVKIGGQSSDTYLINTLSSTLGSGYNFSANVDYEWEFEDDGDFSQSISGTINVSFAGYSTSVPLNNNYSGEWDWESNKEKIEIEINGTSEDFEIKKLTNTELTLENQSGIEYEFEKD